MDSLYSNEIRQYIKSRNWPKGKRLDIEIVEYEDYLGFRLFRDNFNSFNGEDRLQIAMMIKEIMEKVRGDGIPCYLEVAKGDGRGSRA